MKAALDWLSGKKTYIIAFAAAIYGVGIDQHLWPHLVWLDAIIAGGGLAALRAGVEKSAPPPPQP